MGLPEIPDDPTMPIPSGVQRVGRYMLAQRIGQGGMAEVFLARQEGPSDFQKTVVVKRMLAHLTENKKFVEMFLREARVAARLNHPNVVQIFELGQDQGTYFLAMEFIDGITLHRLARRAWARKRALPTEVIVRAVADAALGLHHAHTLVDEVGRPSGLVHRDISPDNLMITRDGVTKVLDFGIARAQQQKGAVTRTGELKGKIPYMSPEQIEGRPLDGRSDLFSLGVTFYWLLCGRRPFDGATEVITLKRVLEQRASPPSSVNKSVPAVLDRIVMRMLEKDPNKRYDNGLALHERLVRVLGGEGASRVPAQELVAEIMAAPEPEDDDPETTALVKSGPASMPISGTFAPTTVTRSTEVGPRRGALLGVTAAAVVGFCGALGLLLLNTSSSEPPARAIAEAASHGNDGAKDGAANDKAADASDGDKSAAGDKSASDDAGGDKSAAGDTSAGGDAGGDKSAGDKRPDDKRVHRAGHASSLRTVALKGPPSVAFRAAGAPRRGPGSGRVRSGARTVVAVDGRRGSVHVVPIVDDVADFNALPTGTLRVSAVPYAQVFLGGEAVGQTPPPRPITLPVGTYTVKLVWEGHTKVQKVTIDKGKTAELRVKMD